MKKLVIWVLRELKKMRLRYSKKSIIAGSAVIGLRSQAEGRNSFDKRSVFYNSFIGFGSYIGENSNIGYTKIGRYTSIGPEVKTIHGIHPTSTFVSTHPVFYSLHKQIGITYAGSQLFEEHKYIDQEKKYSIIIGNDVWIGYGVKIIEGITIGDGAIIAANSTVTKDIPPYTVCAGTPCKPLRSRFNDEQIRLLTDFKWWDKGEQWITENAHRFTDINEFYEAFKPET